MREGSKRRFEPCPCGSGVARAECCEPLLLGTRPAATAEALMRSRYAAYVTMNEPYLLASWHERTRPKRIELHPRQRWLGLRVVRAEAGTATDDAGVVEFIARYRIDGRGHRLHEISRFLRTDAGWFYLDGVSGGRCPQP